MPAMVEINELGACEHCNEILCIDMYSEDESMSAKWYCPYCKKEIGHKSFGYEKDSKGKWFRKYWVGPDKKMTETRPDELFNIGNVTVFVR